VTGVVAAPRWAAVVVNYESGGLLAECVATLRADRSGGEAEIVVVDNGSTDGSLAELRRRFPDIAVVEPGRNLGYAAAANRGIAATRAPVVAVCNPDLPQRPGTAAALLGRLGAEPGLGAVGPAIRDARGERYPSARSVPRLRDAVGHGLLGLVWPGNRFTRRYRQLDADPTRSRAVDWVSGAAIWLRRRALDTVGGWDERYFMYVEDVDLCWRLRARGWGVAYEPAGEVTHVQGASTDRHPYRMLVEHHRSLLRFAHGRWHGVRRVLLVPAGIYLTARAVLAAGLHAARHGRRRATG
jgi:N-acetylglucosaminyl-diphospho-decaprenol L-rhamnosyltransferase